MRRLKIIFFVLIIFAPLYFLRVKYKSEIHLLKRILAYTEPYYNADCRSYGYTYPLQGKPFVVGMEPHGDFVPKHIQDILSLAFSDRKVIYDNTQQPNLIVRNIEIKPTQNLSASYQQWNAPYISCSGETRSLDNKRFRRNAPPMLNFVTTEPSHNKELYFPFAATCGKKAERKVANIVRQKSVAYINSHCTPERETMFALLKNKLPDADALGVCSNPSKQRHPNSWSDLDEVYAKYNFGFAMENESVPGYITEKIINVFRGGAIPIYWGDNETVLRYFNPKAFINLHSFASFEQAVDHIVALNQNPKALKLMRQEPIFIGNKVPEIFKISADPKHPILQEAAQTLRKKYFQALLKDRNL